MPDIMVKKQDSFGYIKLDILYESLLRPFFAAAQKKHNLTSTLIQEPLLINMGTSRIARKGDIEIVTKALQDDKFRFSPNEQKSTIGENLLLKAGSFIDLNVTENFGSPRYML